MLLQPPVAPEHELAADLARIQPVEQRGARAADVEVAGGGRRKPDLDLGAPGSAAGSGVLSQAILRYILEAGWMQTGTACKARGTSTHAAVTNRFRRMLPACAQWLCRVDGIVCIPYLRWQLQGRPPPRPEWRRRSPVQRACCHCWPCSPVASGSKAEHISMAH
jgi:hypothetical protein